MRRTRIIALALPMLLIIGCDNNKARTATAGAAREPGRAAKPAAEALSNLHHAVSTENEAAQKAFDEGLTQVYAFNHDEAVRCFERALKADPNLAMAHW